MAPLFASRQHTSGADTVDADALGALAVVRSLREGHKSRVVLAVGSVPTSCAIIGDHCPPRFHYRLAHLADTERERDGFSVPS